MFRFAQHDESQASRPRSDKTFNYAMLSSCCKICNNSIFGKLTLGKFFFKTGSDFLDFFIGILYNPCVTFKYFGSDN